MSAKIISWDSIRADMLSDPAVKAAYDALEPEFSLANQLIALRAASGLTQREFAQRVGMKQSQLARIESGKQIPKLETLAKLASGAGYSVEVHFIPPKGEQTEKIKPLRIPLSDSDFAPSPSPPVSVIESVAAFLESDDPVAVKVRERHRAKSINEIAAELERCLSFPEEDERLFAVKNVLAGSVTGGGSIRDASDDNDDEIELLDLAESLLEKLASL